MKFNLKKGFVAVAACLSLSFGLDVFALKNGDVEELASLSQNFNLLKTDAALNDGKFIKLIKSINLPDEFVKKLELEAAIQESAKKNDDSSVEFEFDGKKQNLREVMANEKNEANSNLQDFGDWLSRTVVLNSDHLFSKDLILAKASDGNYDFCIFVDSSAVPNEVEGVNNGGTAFSRSALKGLNKVKMVIKNCRTKENKNPSVVLEKNLNLNQNCFKFSLNKNEIEFGKAYQIEFLNADGVVVGFYRVVLPKAIGVSGANEPEAGTLKSLGDKSHVRV